MVESNGAAVARTEATIQTELDIAYKAGKWADVGKLAKELAGFAAAKAVAELAKRQAALVATTLTVKGLIAEVVAFLSAGTPPSKDATGAFVGKLRKLTGLELEGADGVWYSRDFGTTLEDCRLLASTPEAKATGGGGGGSGKRFPDYKNVDMLAKHGDTPSDLPWAKDMSLKQAFESTTDGNKRFAVREKLLKLEEVI